MVDQFQEMDIKIRLNLWDTVGTERYASMNRQYFTDAVCAVFVYDITDSDSLTCVSKWLALLEEHCQQNVLKVLCGNKADLIEERVVAEQAGKNFAEDYEFDQFYEVSACENGEGVADMFNLVGQAISDQASQSVSIYSNSNLFICLPL